MHLIPIKPDELAAGKPLPWLLYDASGTVVIVVRSNAPRLTSFAAPPSQAAAVLPV